MAYLHALKTNAAGTKEYLFNNRELACLFLPLVIEQFLEFLVGLTNSIMVASIGESAVSAVSLVEFVIFLLISVFAALAAGGTVVASQYIGQGKPAKACAAANQLIWFVGLTAVAIMLAVYLAEAFLLGTVFGQITAEVRNQAQTYLRISAFSIPFLGLYGAGVAIFRTMGNARLPMKISLLIGLMTISGNILALHVLDFGILGVAVCTVIARASGALLIILFALNPHLPVHLARTVRHKFDWPMIKNIMGIGIPYGLENGLFHLGRIIVLSLVATFGTAAIAANAVAGTIVLFEVLPGIAIGLGLTVVIARCIGAGDYEQARYYTKKIMLVIYVAHILINAVVLALLPYILSVYALSAEATALTRQIVFWHAVFAVTLWPFAYTLPVTFRAAGDAKYPMYVGVLSMFFCRIALAYLLGGYLQMGVFGTWMAMFIDWFVKSALFLWRYLHERWTLYTAV